MTAISISNQMSCMDVNFLSLLRNCRDPLSLFVCSNHGDPSSPLSFHHSIPFHFISSFLGFSFAIKNHLQSPKCMHVLPHKNRCDQPFRKDSTASLPLFLHLPSSFVNMSMLVAELIGLDWIGLDGRRCWKHELMNESNDLGG